MAPVTIDVFNSARPTVIAILFCPDAANAKKATMTRDDALVTFPGTVTHCNKAATSVKMAWTSVEEISHARRLAEWWWARRPNTKLPTQKLLECQSRLQLSRKGRKFSYNTRDATTFPSILDFNFLLLTVYTARNRKLPTAIFSPVRVVLVSHAIRLTGLFGRKHVVIDEGNYVQDA
jgi:hypothetical protein